MRPAPVPGPKRVVIMLSEVVGRNSMVSAAGVAACVIRHAPSRSRLIAGPTPPAAAGEDPRDRRHEHRRAGPYRQGPHGYTAIGQATGDETRQREDQHGK